MSWDDVNQAKVLSVVHIDDIDIMRNLRAFVVATFAVGAIIGALAHTMQHDYDDEIEKMIKVYPKVMVEIANTRQILYRISAQNYSIRQAVSDISASEQEIYWELTRIMRLREEMEEYDEGRNQEAK